MKTRIGFVSNSSSCSFTLAVKYGSSLDELCQGPLQKVGKIIVNFLEEVKLITAQEYIIEKMAMKSSLKMHLREC